LLGAVAESKTGVCKTAAQNMSNIKYIFRVFQIHNMEIIRNFKVTFDSILVSYPVFAVKAIQIMVLFIVIL
jgi:hypothetical protein